MSERRELEAVATEVEGEVRVERNAEVAELGLSQYAEVRLVDRLRASVGRSVALSLADGSRVTGQLEAVGDDWLIVVSTGRVLVSVAAVASALGAAEGAIPPAALGISERRTIGAVLRQLVAERASVVVATTDGDAWGGRLVRVGADFVEIAGDERVGLLRLDRVVSVKH